MILKDQSIFILGITKFDGSIESTSFTTAKFLAQDNDVYYIDYPYTTKDYFSKKGRAEKVQFFNRKEAFFSTEHCLLKTHTDRLKILVLPPLFSINFLPEGKFYRKLLGLNEHIMVNRIKSIIGKFGIQDFIFINSFNFHYPNVCAKLKPRFAVYHCVDPLITTYDRRHGLKSEKKILEQSDLVICTSKQLYREKIKLNRNTFFIPNAADLSHCSTALDPDLVTFKSLRSIKKPIIGYFGNVERRIDFDLLEKVAVLNPEKSFVFAGPVSDEYVPFTFKQLPNVFFIGKVPYKYMPAVLKGFDTAIIPFKRDEVSATIFPLKLFEYLGAGKPVVSTDFNLDLREYTGDTVVYCRNDHEFSKALDASLSLKSEDDINNRLKIASENTWERRLTEFSKVLFAGYNQKKRMKAKGERHTI